MQIGDTRAIKRTRAVKNTCFRQGASSWDLDWDYRYLQNLMGISLSKNA